MEKKMVTVMCAKERENVFGGEEGEYYLLDTNSVVELYGQKFGEVYTLDKQFMGLYNLNRFYKIE